MGNSQPIKDKQGYQEYQRLGLVKIRQINDPQGGQKISIMELDSPIQSQKYLNLWKQQINRIDDSQSRQILLLPDKHVFQKAGMCGSNGNVNLTYENFPYVLQSQIKNRKKLNRKFLQTQMWYLLYNIIRAGNKFQKINKKIGDINPLNILINDDGQIKIISTCSIPNQLNNFQKIVQDKNAKVYLAPQQLSNIQSIKKGQYPQNINQCKSQVFSIGLTILSSGPPRTINQNLLNQYIGQLKTQYSSYLFNTIVSMLIFQPNQRKNASQIYNQLYPYEYNILELEPFNIKGQNSRMINSQQLQSQNIYGQGQGYRQIQQGNQSQSQYQSQYPSQSQSQSQQYSQMKQSNQINNNINNTGQHITYGIPSNNNINYNYQSQQQKNNNYIDNSNINNSNSGYRRPI